MSTCWPWIGGGRGFVFHFLILKADYRTLIAERVRCGYDPAGCDFAAIAVHDSPADLRNRELMAARVESNLRAVAGNAGTLYDAYPTTATIDLTVKEVQALVTG